VPNIRSAKKRMRQAVGRRARNRDQRSAVRNAVRRVRSAATRAEAESAFKRAEELLDRAARKNLLHANAAARQKSRLRKVIASK
jgi:small subunit ribosomal protein S20